MAKVSKHLPTNLHDAMSMRSWLGRLMDMPGDTFEDDSLEDLRWDVAHTLLCAGAAWYGIHVIAGDLIPFVHGKRELSDTIYIETTNFLSAQPAPTKAQVQAALGHRYDCMVEVKPCGA